MRLGIVLTIAGLLGSVGVDGTGAPDWETGTPAENGLDAGRLQALANAIRDGKEFPDLHSLLVVRNGRLVFEEYFDGYRADQLHTLQSVSKSFTSTLIGIAIARGDIRSVDERVLDFFLGRDDIENLDDHKRAMRVEDLLTMRSGTDYHERGSSSPHDELNSLSRGWDTFVLNRPMLRPPGSYFQYDSGGVILLSSLLEARTGMHADRYAAEHLFAPLGIQQWSWFRNNEGHPHTGGGLDLRPRDMARFGQLYLQMGSWDGRQVVPPEWVEVSIRRHVVFDPPRGDGAVGYGYLWWILRPDPAGAGAEDIYAAMGFRAQYIFVVPEHDMVVVVTGGTRSWVDEQKPVRFLYSHILPSVQRRPRPSSRPTGS
jgi:CubicO group peptidase (beta-lactamase class C family)